MLGGLHKKTHFKASETIKNGVGGSLRVNNDEIAIQFHNMQKQIAMQKKMSYSGIYALKKNSMQASKVRHGL